MSDDTPLSAIHEVAVHERQLRDKESQELRERHAQICEDVLAQFQREKEQNPNWRPSHLGGLVNACLEIKRRILLSR